MDCSNQRQFEHVEILGHSNSICKSEQGRDKFNCQVPAKYSVNLLVLEVVDLFGQLLIPVKILFLLFFLLKLHCF